MVGPFQAPARAPSPPTRASLDAEPNLGAPVRTEVAAVSDIILLEHPPSASPDPALASGPFQAPDRAPSPPSRASLDADPPGSTTRARSACAPLGDADIQQGRGAHALLALLRDREHVVSPFCAIASTLSKGATYRLTTNVFVQ